MNEPKDSQPVPVEPIGMVVCNKCGTADPESKRVIDTLQSELRRVTEERDAEREERRNRFSLDDLNVTHPCEQCFGLGKRIYSNTSTWWHGIGGQMITADVCDVCWGSGDKNKTWPSHKKAALDSKRAEAAESLNKRLVELLRKLHLKAEAGLCAGTFGGARAFLQDILAMSAELLKEVK